MRQNEGLGLRDWREALRPMLPRVLRVELRSDRRASREEAFACSEAFFPVERREADSTLTEAEGFRSSVRRAMASVLGSFRGHKSSAPPRQAANSGEDKGRMRSDGEPLAVDVSCGIEALRAELLGLARDSLRQRRKTRRRRREGRGLVEEGEERGAEESGERAVSDESSTSDFSEESVSQPFSEASRNPAQSGCLPPSACTRVSATLFASREEATRMPAEAGKKTQAAAFDWHAGSFALLREEALQCSSTSVGSAGDASKSREFLAATETEGAPPREDSASVRGGKFRVGDRVSFSEEDRALSSLAWRRPPCERERNLRLRDAEAALQREAARRQAFSSCWRWFASDSLLFEF